MGGGTIPASTHLRQMQYTKPSFLGRLFQPMKTTPSSSPGTQTACPAEREGGGGGGGGGGEGEVSH